MPTFGAMELLLPIAIFGVLAGVGGLVAWLVLTEVRLRRIRTAVTARLVAHSPRPSEPSGWVTSETKNTSPEAVPQHSPYDQQSPR